MTDETPREPTNNEKPEYVYIFVFILLYLFIIWLSWRLGMFNHCSPDALPNDVCHWVS